MKQIIQKMLKKLLSREVMSYLIFGILSTVVNIAVYQTAYAVFSIENLVANAIAWVIAVIFAYYTNSRFVFVKRPKGMKEELKQMSMFFGARLFSLGVDELGMWIMVDVIKTDSLFAKIIMNVVVIVINYIFSKFFIFKPKQ